MNKLSLPCRFAAGLAAFVAATVGMVASAPPASAAMGCDHVVNDGAQNFTYEEEDVMTDVAAPLKKKGLEVRFLTTPPLDISGNSTIAADGGPGPDVEYQDGSALSRYIIHAALSCGWGKVVDDQLELNANVVILATSPTNRMTALFYGDDVEIRTDRINHVLRTLESGYARDEPAEGVIFAMDDLDQFLQVRGFTALWSENPAYAYISIGAVIGVALVFVVQSFSTRKS